MKNGSCLFFSHADSYLSQHILLRSLSFPRCSTVTICTSSDCVGDLFLDLSSPLIYVPVPAPIPYLFHHCSSIISLDFQQPKFYPLLQVCLGCSWHFSQNTFRVLIGIALIRSISLLRIHTLRVLSLPLC